MNNGGNDKRSWLQQYSEDQERKSREAKETEKRRHDRVLDSAWETIHRIDAIVNRPIKGVL